jgi:hypothetical protein
MVRVGGQRCRNDPGRVKEDGMLPTGHTSRFTELTVSAVGRDRNIFGGSFMG